MFNGEREILVAVVVVHYEEDLSDYVCFFLVVRIHESGGPYSYWVCSDGIRGILCEAHLYSYQQHHRRCYLR